jgi:hypothetical protein
MAMKTKYEYRVVRFDLKWNVMGSKLGTDFAEMERQLNVLGAEGWELLKISEILCSAVATLALIATFKRTAE